MLLFHPQNACAPVCANAAPFVQATAACSGETPQRPQGEPESMDETEKNIFVNHFVN